MRDRVFYWHACNNSFASLFLHPVITEESSAYHRLAVAREK